MKQHTIENSTDNQMCDTTDGYEGTNTSDLDALMTTNRNAAAKKDPILEEKEKTAPANPNVQAIVEGIEIIEIAKLNNAVILTKSNMQIDNFVISKYFHIICFQATTFCNIKPYPDKAYTAKQYESLT